MSDGELPLGIGQAVIPAGHSSFLPTGGGQPATEPRGTQSRTPARVVHDAFGNQVPLYEREKQLGLRRENGARKLKRLTTRHMRIISLHLAGEKGEDIARICGVTNVTVSRILNDPLARKLISQVYEDRQNEIDALAGEAIDAVRQTLKGDHTAREKLAAVDKFVKLKDTIGRPDDSAKTAEDVVAQIFNIEGQNVQINLNRR